MKLGGNHSTLLQTRAKASADASDNFGNFHAGRLIGAVCRLLAQLPAHSESAQSCAALFTGAARTADVVPGYFRLAGPREVLTFDWALSIEKTTLSPSTDLFVVTRITNQGVNFFAGAIGAQETIATVFGALALGYADFV